jgi:hypothetical protein
VLLTPSTVLFLRVADLFLATTFLVFLVLVIFAFLVFVAVVSGIALRVGWLNWMKADPDTQGNYWDMLEA